MVNVIQYEDGLFEVLDYEVRDGRAVRKLSVEEIEEKINELEIEIEKKQSSVEQLKQFLPREEVLEDSSTEDLEQ